MASTSYHLRCELRSHEQDVRGVLTGEFGIATSSRDKTIKTWVEQSPNSYTVLTTLVGHTDFVGPLAFLPPNQSGLPHGALVSGSRDTNVMLWDVTTGAALQTFKGHTYQVTAVDVSPTGEIVSGALDKTIRVWRPSQDAAVAVLEGHEGPVLAVAATPMGDILSGSGDSTIKVWSDGKCTATLKGHADTVRALAIFPGLGFVSASHDLTLRVWDMQGNTISELVGHTAIIYAVAVFPSQHLIASGSEDNTARIWKASGECLQVLEHPGCIWDLTFSEAGELVTGCSDGVARVWSVNPEHKADAEVVAALQSHLDQRKAAVEQKQDEAIPGLPPGLKVVDHHSLLQPGSKDGETKVVKEANGAVNAYAWDAKSFKWDMIGEVVGRPVGGATGAKKLHQGQEWDFVFDVDVAEGEAPKKLPYNLSENPYIAADRFIEEEGLPAYFKEQIAQFIMKNSGQASTPAGLAPGTSVTGGFCDPFTGGGSSSAPSQPPAAGHQKGQLTHIPARLFMAFDNAPNLDALGRKVLEFNTSLHQQQNAKALNEQETASLGEMLKKLAAAAGPSSAGFSDAEMAVLVNKLLGWPAGQLFPALDIARMAALDAQAAAALAAQPGVLAGSVSRAAQEPAIAANQQLALRLVCNCFKHTALRTWVVSARSDLLDLLSDVCSTSSKAVRVSLATLLYNFAVYCQQSAPGDSEAKLQVLSAAIELLTHVPLDDTDSIFRGLVALGTLCHGDKETSSLARDLGAQDVLRRVNDSPEANSPAGGRVLEAAFDVVTLLMQR